MARMLDYERPPQADKEDSPWVQLPDGGVL